MKILSATACGVMAMTSAGFAVDDFLDRVDETLTISAFDDQLRARLSGTFDLETYFFTRPAPGLIDADGHHLVNPRLTLFFDAQFGARIYVFAQARADRGFDPSDGGAEVRMDEYALRISPWEDGRFSVQIGKFATVVGNWVARHGSWENPFITAPVPYENLTAIWDSAAPGSATTLLDWAHVQTRRGEFGGDESTDQHLRNPIVWGPSYTSGLSIAGRVGKFDYAAEVKNAALSSRPEAWDASETQWQYPTFSGRLGFRPNQAWNLGVSASTGTYLRPDAAGSLSEGRGLEDYRQSVLAQDIGFAWRHLQVWAEFYEARFEIPEIGNVDTLAYYLEAKYKLTPQLFAALRWNQQLFARIAEDEGGRSRWGRDFWRIDGALGYRLSAHTQLKMQYSLRREESAPRDYGHTVAAQFTLRF